jgi:hypothetical protein
MRQKNIMLIKPHKELTLNHWKIASGLFKLRIYGCEFNKRSGACSVTPLLMAVDFKETSYLKFSFEGNKPSITPQTGVRGSSHNLLYSLEGNVGNGNMAVNIH